MKTTHQERIIVEIDWQPADPGDWDHPPEPRSVRAVRTWLADGTEIRIGNAEEFFEKRLADADDESL